MILVPEGYATIILVTLTLLLQSLGMAVLIEWIKSQFPHGIRPLSLFRSIVLVVRLTSLLVSLHMLEILLWASFYRWKSFATWEAAFYFSAASYSTVGSGDLFLKQMWRTMGPVESVTGMLMCGLSASFLFAIVTRLVEHEAPNARTGFPHHETEAISKQAAPGKPETVLEGTQDVTEFISLGGEIAASRR